MPMDSNRIKQVSPSVARLKYKNNHNSQKQAKQQKKDAEQDIKKESTDNGNVIDDFA